MAYNQYEKYIETIVRENDLSTFKSNPTYNYILEHVAPHYGQQYLQIIKQVFQLPEYLIRMFGHMNDAIGSPKQYTFDDDLTISPTSLRYICHALLILAHMKECNQQQVKIVELGCGYGGLACALSFFSSFMNVTIQQYHFVDLESPLQLQKKYLEKFVLEIPVFFHKASEFGADIEGSDYFLISNYCFSEIEHDLQARYLETLFPKCTHGFITWNHIDVYDIGKEISIQEEYPLTGSKNKYVRF